MNSIDERTRLATSADGWRGLIGVQFTRDSALRVVHCILDMQESAQPGRSRVLVAHDTRDLGTEVARYTAAHAAARKVKHEVTLVRHLPTSTASFMTVQDFDLAILVTASHNPPDWNGIKVKIAPGLPAPPTLVAQIDHRIATLAQADSPSKETPVVGRFVSAKPFMARHAAAAARFVPKESRRPFRVAIDGLGGIAEPALATLGQALGWETHLSGRVPARDFGGIIPDPSKPAALAPLAERIVRQAADFGLGLDGDGDRIYALDEIGCIVQPHDLMALLTIYEQEQGRTIRSVAVTQSTGMSVRLAAAYIGANVIETPIGFKHLAELLASGEADVAGGSVGDIAFRERSLDRDPLSVAAHLSQVLADRGRPLSAEIRELRASLGTENLVWLEAHLPGVRPPDSEVCSWLLDTGARSVGIEQSHVDLLEKGAVRLTGPDHQWLMLRPSTTEGGLRLYGELTGAGANPATAICSAVESRLSGYRVKEI
ncbi:MAG: hypothetical protein ACR2RE_28595 [Geminicoccaceae bacterium]